MHRAAGRFHARGCVMRHEFKPAAWAFLLVLAIAASGCVTPTKPPTTLDVLNETEAMLTAGWDALNDAMTIGTIAQDSKQHVQLYAALDKADQLLDSAWIAYEGQRDGEARAQADIARSIYMQVRPILVEAAGGE